MITVEEVKDILQKSNRNPDDFNIKIFENGYSVFPKWSYQPRQIAKEEDTPIIADVNDVAEFSTIIAMDKDEIAEMLVYALQKIDELEARLDG